MIQDEFKNYQSALNAQRVNQLNTTPKLAPTVLLGDEFEETIQSIPITITLPPPMMMKPLVHTNHQSKSNPLF